MGRHSKPKVHQQGQRPVPTGMRPVRISGPVPVYGLAELVVDNDGLSVHFLEHAAAASVEVDDVGALRDLRDALTVFLDRNS